MADKMQKAREALARKRKQQGNEPARSPLRAGGETTRARGSSTAVVLAVLAAFGVVALWLLGLAPRNLTTGADLVPWTGGGVWRFRSGQFIDARAAESLSAVGAELAGGCNPIPMTLDVSRMGGGDYPPHKSHQTGLDVDIRTDDLAPECRISLQATLRASGWRVWYDGPNATEPTEGGRHITHLHARFNPT